jgi:hypothetical protein
MNTEEGFKLSKVWNSKSSLLKALRPVYTREIPTGYREAYEKTERKIICPQRYQAKQHGERSESDDPPVLLQPPPPCYISHQQEEPLFCPTV